MKGEPAPHRTSSCYPALSQEGIISGLTSNPSGTTCAVYKCEGRLSAPRSTVQDLSCLVPPTYKHAGSQRRSNPSTTSADSVGSEEGDVFFYLQLERNLQSSRKHKLRDSCFLERDRVKSGFLPSASVERISLLEKSVLPTMAGITNA